MTKFKLDSTTDSSMRAGLRKACTNIAGELHDELRLKVERMAVRPDMVHFHPGEWVTAVEFKSSKDSMKRALRQAVMYLSVCRKAIFILDKKWIGTPEYHELRRLSGLHIFSAENLALTNLTPIFNARKTSILQAPGAILSACTKAYLKMHFKNVPGIKWSSSKHTVVNALKDQVSIRKAEQCLYHCLRSKR